jgi:hypothetical protein
MSTVLQFADALQQSTLGSSIAESRYAFPIIEGVHLIGLSVAIGLLFITDLRLADVLFKNVPAAVVLRHLRPWVLGGFAVILISGGLLFLAEAPEVINSPAFALKFVFIAIAAANAAYFEFVIARRPGVLADGGVLPQSVKFAGLASLTLWTLVIVCGRLIPYLPGA